MAEKELERIYTIPLRSAKHGPASKAAPRAIKVVRKFLARHMKVEMDKVWIDESVNHAIWSRGKYKIPSKIRVRAVKFDDGVIEVSLPETEFRAIREELKTIKETKEKEPILKREVIEGEEKKEVEEETKEEAEEEETAETEEVPAQEVSEEVEKEETSEEKDKKEDIEKEKVEEKEPADERKEQLSQEKQEDTQIESKTVKEEIGGEEKTSPSQDTGKKEEAKEEK
ncbi:MAG TPA: 50S ribosomal protein L31e [Thermoplasmatales archaeon]|nr:50S ribosomal protein L31e [Thermoplasmatales archaeon]